MSRIFLVMTCATLSVVELWAGGQEIVLRLYPRPDAPVAGVIAVTDGFQVLSLEEGWVEVRRGEIRAWMSADDLWLAVQARGRSLKAAAAAPGFPPSGHLASAAGESNSWSGLVNFLGGDYERWRKISDPHYRDRVSKLISEWGPLYYWRTRLYYIKGIRLCRFLDDRFSVNLAKRRIYYRQIFGQMWSDEFIEGAIQSNRGWLSNRHIFGKGREYFLELSYHF